MPPDGAWRTDAEGRDYYLAQLPKAQGQRMENGNVRTAWGVPVQVEREDQDFYYYKVFRPPPERPAAPQGPTAAERARIVASYAVDVPTSSRLGFVPFGEGLPTKGQWRQGFALADMDRDGHLDLVHGPPRKRPGPPVIFLGDGHGHWRRWGDARFPPLHFDYGDTATGDIDGDGRPDVALGMHLTGMAAMLGDGRGAFRDASRGLDVPPPGGAPAAFSSRAVALVDWDGDHHLDLLALGEGPRMGADAASGTYGLVLYRGRGDGSWERYDQGTGRDQPFGQSLVLGDFDGDGRVDAATGSSTFGRTNIVSLGTPEGGWRTVTVDGVRPSGYVRAVAAGDFDGDGRDDLAVAYASFELATWRTGIDVLLARPEGRWERRGLASEESRSGPYALGAGDLDGNRTLDVVVLGPRGETTVFLGDGRGAFTRETPAIAPFPGGCRGVAVTLADLDGEAGDEIVAAFAEESSGMTDEPVCPGGGGITAWKAAPR